MMRLGSLIGGLINNSSRVITDIQADNCAWDMGRWASVARQK